ncbi:FAD synthase [Mycoplasma sp. 4463]|uniref:FAD synthase n=1 Tax=Mycoplasma sp. 4463 TaxID=3400998 RepID=UPI003AAC0B36
MEDLLIYDLDDFETKDNDIFLLGEFNSFHLGHYQLYKKAIELKKQNEDSRIILVCFNSDKLLPKDNGTSFTDKNAKYMQLTQLDLDSIIELDFEAIRNWDGILFLNKLGQNKKVTFISGEDYKCGHRASYNFELAKNENTLNKNYSFITEPTQKIQNVKISTSKLKESIEFGDLDFVNSLLVFNYAISCNVNSDLIITKSANLVNIHPGVYSGVIYFEDLVIYASILIDLDHSVYLDLFNFDLEDLADSQIVVEFRKVVRLIKNEYEAFLSDTDIAKSKEILFNY